MMRCAGDDGCLREEIHPDVVVHPITRWENTRKYRKSRCNEKQFFPATQVFFPIQPRTKEKRKTKNAVMSVAHHYWLACPSLNPCSSAVPAVVIRPIMRSDRVPVGFGRACSSWWSNVFGRSW